MQTPHRFPLLTWPVLLLTVIVASLVMRHQPGFYPSLRINTGTGLSILYMNDNQDSEHQCESLLTEVEASIKSYCPNCVTTDRQCRPELPKSMQSYFAESPLPYPVAYLPSGMMLFDSNDDKLALSACQAAAKNIRSSVADSHANCYPAESKRAFYRARNQSLDLVHLGFAVLAFLLALLICKLGTYLIVRYEHLHARFSHDHTHSGPQKFHALPTPRIGGLPIFTALLICVVLLQALPNKFSDTEYSLLVLASLPAFMGGLTEDITKKVGVRERLILTMLSGLFGAWLLGAVIPHLEIPYLDQLFLWAPFAIAFTAFAVGGIANSLNIIDGYNGLASGFGIIASLTLAIIAAMNGDHLLLYANLSMTGALIGFIIWNWPHGKIFLGDGGAYLLGFWLAEIGILTVVRNPSVSVWLPLAVMIYPTFETLYSIYRRRFKHQTDPGQPDAAHLHQLVFKRLVRIHVGSKNPQHKLRRNSRVAPYFWIITAFFCTLAILARNNTYALQALCLSFSIAYTSFYQRLKTWKLPNRIITRSKSKINK